MTVANEIRLPVGAPVQFHLASPDVVHSFWIPPLGGKIDMIPGRVTRLVLTPTRSGTFRGACAEYCGTSHALMAFPVVVMEPADFARWLTAQALPAQAPTTRWLRADWRRFWKAAAALATASAAHPPAASSGLISPMSAAG